MGDRSTLLTDDATPTDDAADAPADTADKDSAAGDNQQLADMMLSLSLDEPDRAVNTSANNAGAWQFESSRAQNMFVSNGDANNALE